MEKNISGEKAYNLNILSKAGLNVPKWFLVTSLEQEIEVDQNKLYAIRSSAVGEDSAIASFAGLLKTYLYVRPCDIKSRIEDVFNSINSAQVQFYKEKKGLADKDSKIAVIVQEMVNSDVSGVSFSCNPLDNSSVCVISSVFGLGEGLVSGELSADTYRIKDGIVDKTIVEKPDKFVFNKAKGYSITKEKNENPWLETLKEEQAREIAIITKKIEQIFSCPLDIEWAYENNILYILQARPITTLDDSKEIIFDNSNIVESYCATTLPLTFSFINDVYSEVYKQFLLIMGVEKDLIEQNSDIFLMLGYIKGRVYYNLLNWYRVLKLIPGYEINSKFMESMMGVKQPLNQTPKVKKSSKNKYFRVFSLFLSLVFNLLTLDKNIKKFYSTINATLVPYENGSLKKKNANQLIEVYYELEKKLLKNWQAPLVNDFYAMIFYGLLKKLLIKLDSAQTLQNDLLMCQEGIVSVEPIKRIKEISNKICLNEDLKEFFLNNSEEQIVQNLENLSVNQDIQSFIEKFGNRCIQELKLETITYKQDSRLLICLIKSYVKQGFIDLDKEEEKNKKSRSDINNTVKKIKNPLFFYVLKQARKLIKNRENLRFERTRLFGIVREIFLRFGQIFEEESIIKNKRDIFYLSKEEIFNYVEGTSIDTDLKLIIENRKKQFIEFDKQTLKDRFKTKGIVYCSIDSESNNQEFEKKDNVLQGIGCCKGIVRAKVKIINSIEQAGNLEGKILVAKRTDPGWVPLFAISRGILIERGSILSHGAIVAREMGIPAIVGINNLFSLLKDDMEVEMDGKKGSIRIING